MKKVTSLTTLLLLLCLSTNIKAQNLWNRENILKVIEKVNNKWQSQHPNPGNAFWDNAAYHTGNMEAYYITGNDEFRKYSENWAIKNQWKGAKSDNRANWKYSYGENDDFVLFGDWQICFQTYIDLHNIHPDQNKIARAIEVMEYQMSTEKNDYWWWADGLYMVMPVMTKLYNLTGNEMYLDKLDQYMKVSKEIMYDEETGLFFRDGKYVYPKHKSLNQKKDFWARGDGWVLAGLAKVLQDMPKDSKYFEDFKTTYLRMAKTIAEIQQAEGYWTRSMLDPEHATGPERSGTAFFTYGLLWGVNNGYLDEATYMPTIKKAWKYLTETALQDDGTIGYVQPIGERAIPGQIVNARSTANFGVGAFLLASSEMIKYIDNKEGWMLVWSDEFNNIGAPDNNVWSFEHGFVRNNELQWYQKDNASCNNGILTIEGRREKIKNPNYIKESGNWKENREFAEYTASSMITSGRKEFLYGRFLVRAKIPAVKGSWPAIWTLGTKQEWPNNGEIDMLEFYRVNDEPSILANTCWGNEGRFQQVWNSKITPFSYFLEKDPQWADKFHVWRMDWDKDYIRLYVDDELFNETKLEDTFNKSTGEFKNPFRQPHYILLNLALGGNGGDPSETAFPLKYEIDYVRVYQKQEDKKEILPAELWLDNEGNHINAHGGGLLYHEGKYYWYGEHKSDNTPNALVGVTCYSSEDLVNWKNEGVALPVVTNDNNHDIARGCVMERPKVIYNEKTQKFVMWFHLELKDRGYEAARAALAVSDTPNGPFEYVKSIRPNANKWPKNLSKSDRKKVSKFKDADKWWSPEWMSAVDNGLFVCRDIKGGQMSRDMTLFVDDNGKAYHIYSSEENLTIHIAELSDDYLSHTGKYTRLEPGGHNEAPAIFKKDGYYWMITSGCTGWDPNEARMFKSKNIFGPWEKFKNPCKGKLSEITFGGQSNYILPIQGKKDAFIFMADKWTPRRPSNGRYIWLPIQFENNIPVIEWMDSWNPETFFKN